MKMFTFYYLLFFSEKKNQNQNQDTNHHCRYTHKMEEPLYDIILTIQEIVKNTTIFDEVIYENSSSSNEDLNIQTSIDKYIKTLKSLKTDQENNRNYTISEKVKNNEYKSIKEFYKDFVIVCFILINTLNKFSGAYYRIDKYFQVVSELLLRYLGTGLNKEINVECDVKDVPAPSSLKKGLDTQFDSIMEFYQAPVKKLAQVEFDLQKNAINKSTSTTYINRMYNKDTLFTSLMHKSILDRSQEAPIDEKVKYVDVLPVDVTNTIDAPKLGAVMPLANKNIPDPTLPNTRILDKLMNPSWYTLPVETWVHSLITDNDEDMNHIVSIVTKNSSLLSSPESNEYLHRKLDFLKKYNLNKVGEIDDSEELETIKKQILEKRHAEESSKDEKINLEYLCNWKEDHYYNDEEIELLTKCKSMKEVQDLISKYLVQLSKLQKHRLKISKSMKANPVEVELYGKIKRLIKFVLLNGDKEKVKSVKLNVTKNVPVLQANYSGTLPVKKISMGGSPSAINHTYKSKHKRRR